MAEVFIEEARKEIEKFPTLGDMVWWTVSGVRINRVNLERLFEDAGLEKEWLPRPIIARNAFLKALKAVEVHVRKEKFLIRKVVEDDEKIAYSIVKEDADVEEIKLQYENLNAIIFNKKDESVEFRGDILSNQVKEAVTEHLANYHSNDMRYMILRIVKTLSGISVRESGGVYFIPKENREYVKALEKLLACLGDSEFNFLGIIDTEKTKATLWETFKREFSDNLKYAEEELVKALSSGRPIDKRSLDAKLKKYKEAKEKAETYASLLQEKAKDFHKKIDELEQKVNEAFLTQLLEDVAVKLGWSYFETSETYSICHPVKKHSIEVKFDKDPAKIVFIRGKKEFEIGCYPMTANDIVTKVKRLGRVNRFEVIAGIVEKKGVDKQKIRR